MRDPGKNHHSPPPDILQNSDSEAQNSTHSDDETIFYPTPFENQNKSFRIVKQQTTSISKNIAKKVSSAFQIERWRKQKKLEFSKRRRFSEESEESCSLTSVKSCDSSKSSDSDESDEKILFHERLQPKHDESDGGGSKFEFFQRLQKQIIQNTHVYFAVAFASLLLLCWRHYTLDRKVKPDIDEDFPLLVLPGQLTQAQIEANLEALFGDPDPDLYEYEENYDEYLTEPDLLDGHPTAVPKKKLKIMNEKRSDPPNLEEIDSGNVDQWRVKDYHFNVGQEDYKPLKRSEDATPLQAVLEPTMPSLMKLREEVMLELDKLQEDREKLTQRVPNIPPSDGPLLPLEALPLEKSPSDTEIAPTSIWLEDSLVVNITFPLKINSTDSILPSGKPASDFELSRIKKSQEERYLRHQDVIPTKKFPKMIIIGAKKCGTTPLKMFLSHHPQFRDKPGEKHFFDKTENYEKGFEFYLDQMDYSYDDEINFEKTSDYFDRNLVPERIAKLNDSIKLVAVLCDPVQRAVSHYNHILNNLNNQKNPAYVKLKSFVNFDELLDTSFKNLLGTKNLTSLTQAEVKKKIEVYQDELFTKKRRQAPPAPDFLLTGGAYSSHLSRWYKHFAEEQIHLVNGADLVEDPGGVMVDLARFMNVDPLINRDNFVKNEELGFYCIKTESSDQEFCVGDHSKHGKSRRLSEKHPISDTVRFRLEDFYAPFVDELEAMTGRRDFSKKWSR